MTLWHRAPREVYRVYGQDEYLAEQETVADEQSSPPSPEAEALSQASRSGRLVGLGLLVGVILGALGLVVLNASHRPSAPPPAAVGRDGRAGTAENVSGADAGPRAQRTSIAGRRSMVSRRSAASDASTDMSDNRETAVRGSSNRRIVRIRSSGSTPVRSFASRPWSMQGPAESGSSPTSEKPWQPIVGEFDFER